MSRKGQYLLNISTGKIHDGKNLCFQGRRIAPENQKWSDSFEELVDFYEGDKKGIACSICSKNKENMSK